jgi:hypothetical protein
MPEKEEKETKGPKIEEIKKELNKYEWQLLRILQHYNDKTKNWCEIQIVKEKERMKISTRNSWITIEYKDGEAKFEYMKYDEIPKKQWWWKRIQFTIVTEKKKVEELFNLIIDIVLKMPMDLNNLVRVAKMIYGHLIGEKKSEESEQ